MHRSFWLLLGGLLAVTSCHRGPGPNVAATVNNRPITYAELDKFYKRQFVVNTQGLSQDQIEAQKLDVLRTLIDNEIMLQRAEKAGLLATDSEVDTKFTELRTPFTQEEFNKQLKTQGMTVEDLRTQIRRELSLQKLVNKEIISHITISDADVTNFYNANRAGYNFPEPQLRIARILVTPAENHNVQNLKNDKAQNNEQALQKISAIAARLKQGEDFASLAQNYSEDPNSAANGGDLGYVGESALDKADPELRKFVLSMNPGQISAVLKTAEGYQILKLISKEPAGQRELNDPRVQQNIRNLLMNRKDQLLRAAYLEIARSEAKVVNYYARTVLDQAAKSQK